MFTGIITRIGALAARQVGDGSEMLTIDAGDRFLENSSVGDSIAVNGVCLTVTGIDGVRFSADVSAESLACTTLGDLAPGSRLNLEHALRASDALGGHLVSGHVDAVAEVLDCRPEAQSVRVFVALPDPLAALVAPKGSICVDGTSLTVNEVEPGRFGVNIIPHTLEATVAGDYRPGTRVNLEADIIARYVARVLEQSR
ncbi:MAG: riboflavin synthase [Gammaproteobacteria bacterium]|nr:riboflavin synthase [Gammaproteobacteria bacterium]NNF59960.1 riboflavin synthase [Gammaproteobacteria bacterium]NNM19676.1 riboflavin synthase [Gammaproteobacteria bacterium]